MAKAKTYEISVCEPNGNFSERTNERHLRPQWPGVEERCDHIELGGAIWGFKILSRNCFTAVNASNSKKESFCQDQQVTMAEMVDIR